MRFYDRSHHGAHWLPNIPAFFLFSSLDNEFYTNLKLAVTQGWVEKEAAEGHYQWMRQRGPPEMMFHADMCLIKDIKGKVTVVAWRYQINNCE